MLARGGDQARHQERGVTFEAEIDLVESLGAGEIREGHEQIVARLDPTSKVERRESAELWADTSKLHLFDPESGDSLRRSKSND